MDALLFMLFAAIAVVCGINLVVQTHPISSALSLFGVMGALAALYADRRSALLVLDAQRASVRTGDRRIFVPPQHHHSIHVDRADAQRRESQLHHVLLQTEASRRTYF